MKLTPEGAKMGRRKQARPTRRSPEYYEEVVDHEPSAKLLREEQFSPEHPSLVPSRQTTKEPSILCHSREMSPSCSKDSVLLSDSCDAEASPIRKSMTNPLLMLEKSLKRFEPRKPQQATQQSRTQSTTTFANGLGALFQFVGKMHDDSTWERSLIQMDRQKVLNMKLQIKSDGMKLACIKCGEIPTNIDKHLKEVHDVKTSADWLKNIRVVSDEENLMSSLASSTQSPANSPHLIKLMSLINTVDKK